MCVKFQIDYSETVEGVDYTNLTSCISHFLKISKFEMAVILSNMIFSFPKRQVHNLSMPATFVPIFRLIAQKLWKKLIINFFKCDG